MSLNAFWIILIFFVIVIILQQIVFNKILTYLIKNYPSISQKYNPKGYTISEMYIAPPGLSPIFRISMDAVFTNKLTLDGNLKKIIIGYRFLVLIIFICVIGLLYIS